VDDQPTLIVKLPQAHENARMLLIFAVEIFLEFSFVDVKNMLVFYKLNKMSI